MQHQTFIGYHQPQVESSISAWPTHFLRDNMRIIFLITSALANMLHWT